MSKITKFNNIIQSIDWSKYKIPAIEGDEQHSHMDICEVFDQRLESIKDTIIKCGTPNNKVDLEYIDKLQDLLKLLDEQSISKALIMNDL